MPFDRILRLRGLARQNTDPQSIIVVPDGKLHLLPFSALSDGGGMPED